ALRLEIRAAYHRLRGDFAVADAARLGERPRNRAADAERRPRLRSGPRRARAHRTAAAAPGDASGGRPRAPLAAATQTRAGSSADEVARRRPALARPDDHLATPARHKCKSRP